MQGHEETTVLDLVGLREQQSVRFDLKLQQHVFQTQKRGAACSHSALYTASETVKTNEDNSWTWACPRTLSIKKNSGNKKHISALIQDFTRIFVKYLLK